MTHETNITTGAKNGARPPPPLVSADIVGWPQLPAYHESFLGSNAEQLTLLFSASPPGASGLSGPTLITTDPF